MTLKTRVIATVLYDGRAVVKGRGFAADRVIGTPAQVIRLFASRDVDELVFLDVFASRDGRGPDLALIEGLAADTSFPFAVGGGIRSIDDAKAVIRAGADKVVMRTWADATRINDVARALGAQALVVSIDCQGDDVAQSRWDAEMAVRCGAGELLLQSVARDGTLDGYDIALIEGVAEQVSVPVIASGGCSGPQDMARAISAGASAVAAGALFSFTDTTPAMCRAFLRGQGVAVRS